ncbi:MAG: GntR family transcriptional regulator [Verrucomicrobiota bacterium]
MKADSLRRQAYEHIQQKILSGELTGGRVVSELSLAREIGISRTPVRDAIRRLEHEGVLEQVPRYGTMVRQLQRRDLVELYELREALEPYAVAQAAGRLQADELSTLKKLCEEIRLIARDLQEQKKTALDAALMQRLLSADMGFHMLLIRASGNGRMMKIVADSRLLARIFGTPRQEHTLDVLEETHRFHSQILQAVENGDRETARRLMAEHIRASMCEALEHYDRSHAEGNARRQPLDLPGDILSELERIEKRPHAPRKRGRK